MKYVIGFAIVAVAACLAYVEGHMDGWNACRAETLQNIEHSGL